MKKKKLLGVMAALALTVISLGNGMVHTYAANGNYTDRAYKFNLMMVQQYTEKQIKYTSSSVYCAVSSSPTAYLSVSAQGEYGTSWVNKTVGGWATVPAGTPSAPAKRRIRASLLEANNYQALNVRLYFMANGKDGWVTGVWSPDCLGDYPAVN